MIGCVIVGAIGMDQNGEFIAVDGQERQNSIEQCVVKDDLVHRFWRRTDRSYVTSADQNFGKGLGDFSRKTRARSMAVRKPYFCQTVV
jgi:hypothetical protein